MSVLWLEKHFNRDQVISVAGYSMGQARRIIVFALLFVLSFAGGNPAIADQLPEQIVLGGETLSKAPLDIKAPEPGFVTAKYGFKIAKDFVPYMGTGLAYTYQADSKSGDITRIKTGVAAQVGFNYLLGENLSLKLDYNYLTVSPDVLRGDPKPSPQSLGIGLHLKF